MKKIIDISAYQTDLDWAWLIDNGVEGVIIKLGEYSHLDDMFIEHVNHAVEYGLPYGVYYFSHACTHDDAVREAEQVASWLNVYLRGETPPLGIWLDAESKTMLYRDSDITPVCMAFLNRLTDFGHQFNGIYSSWNWFSKDGERHINIDELPSYVPLWVAQYSNHNDLKEEYPDRDIKFWQFTDTFLNMNLDGNVYYD